MCKCNPEVDVEYCWKGGCKSGWGGPMVEDRSVLLREEKPPLCQHQWLAIRGVERPNGKEWTGSIMDTGLTHGIVVQCANCETTKELWG